MSHHVHASRLAVLLALASGALAACQALAGIEDRKYDPTANTGEAGATGSSASAQCQKYCALAKEVCQGDNTLYTIDDDDAACLATCALMGVGIVGEPALGNTVDCRINQLKTGQPAEIEASDKAVYCANASAGGNGKCGNNCESYCQFFASACQTAFPTAIVAQYNQEKCVADCAGLKDTGRFDRAASYTGDTLQCRLVHISAAVSTTDGPTIHCPHAQLQAQTHADPAMPCTDDPTAMLTDDDCDGFCTLERAVCRDYPVYESQAQCLAVCKALPKGMVGNLSENTVGCRKYHSYNAMGDDIAAVPAAQSHCPHTGPGGDGHCGSSDDPSSKTTTGNCESYCLLLETACGATTTGLDPADAFQTNFANQKACTQACGMVPGAGPNQGYTVTPEPKGDSVQCRLLHVSRALATPLTECAAALGGAPCK